MVTLYYVACVILEGNKVEDFKYKTLFYPVTSIAAIILYAVVLAMLFDQTEKIVIYFGIPSVLLLFVGYKILSIILRINVRYHIKAIFIYS